MLQPMLNDYSKVTRCKGETYEYEEDTGALVRKAAVEAIAQIASQEETMKIVEKMIEDEYPEVKVAAIKVISEVACKGDVQALQMLQPALSCNDLLFFDNANVRKSAVEAVAKLAVQGDAQVLKMVQPALKDERADVRAAAATAIACFGITG